jgi:hypothetical protein
VVFFVPGRNLDHGRAKTIGTHDEDKIEIEFEFGVLVPPDFGDNGS